MVSIGKMELPQSAQGMLISRSSSLAVIVFKFDGDIPAIVINGDSIESVKRVPADMGSTLSWPV